MAASCCLQMNETAISFESWRQNLIYVPSLDKIFVPFLNLSWRKKNCHKLSLRGVQHDGLLFTRPQHLTAVQKNSQLQLLFDQIANFSVLRRVTQLYSQKLWFFWWHLAKISDSIMVFNQPGLVLSTLTHYTRTWRAPRGSLPALHNIFGR